MKTKFNFFTFKWVAEFFKWVGGFFSEITPQSMMRFMCLMIVSTGCYIMIGQYRHNLPVDWMQGGIFIGIGLAGKYVQKKDEVKGQQPTNVIDEIKEVVKP